MSIEKEEDDEGSKPRKRAGKLSPEKLTLTERTTQAMELRRAGYTFEQIARHLGLTEKAVYKLIDGAFKARQRYCQETTEQVVALHTARLEAMFLALRDRIDHGDSRAIEVALKVLERQAKMLGLDAPEKQQLRVDLYQDHTDEELIREAERLRVDIKVLGIQLQPGVILPLPGEDVRQVPPALHPPVDPAV